jgi:PAS domain S-box-containing protein
MTPAGLPPSPVALRVACAVLAVAGGAATAPTLWRVGLAPGVERDGALVVIAVAFAALALCRGRRAAVAAAVAMLAGATLLLAAPLALSPAATAPGEAALRAPFAVLCGLATLAVALLLVGRPRAHRGAAVVGGILLATIIARGASALAGDAGSAALWPVPRLFVAPLALVPLLVWPAWRDACDTGAGRMAASARLLLHLMAGAMVLALVGHAVGSRLLTTVLGDNPLPLQSALATLCGVMFLHAVLDRTRARFGWALALCGFALAGLASAGLPTVAEALRGGLLPPEGLRPGRALVGSSTFLLMVAGGLAAAAADARPWRLRFAQIAGIIAVGGGAVAMSGMLAEVLYGVDPILGASQLSFLGLLGLVCAGSALFLAATRRASRRRMRTEAVPAAVAAIALAITISLWGGADRQSMDAIGAAGEVALEAMKRSIGAELESRDRDLARLAARLAETEPARQAEVLAVAGPGLGVRYRTLARLTWLPPGQALSSVVEPRLDVPGLRPVRAEAELTGVELRLLRAVRRGAGSGYGAGPPVAGLPRSIALVQRVELADGGTGVLLGLFAVTDELLPVLIGSPVPGFGASAVFDGVPFGVLGAGAPPAPGTPLARFVRESSDPMYRMPVRLAVWPLPATVERMRSRLPQAILVAGSLIAVLVGLVAALAGAARDRARRALAAQHSAEASRREIADLLEGLPDAFFAYDREWRFAHLNRAAEALILRPRAALLGTSLWDSTPRAREYFGLYYERVMQRRSIERFELYYDVKQVWLAVQVFPLPDGIGVIARDVSREREVLDTLRRREADLAQALEIADLARLEMDAEERVTWSGAASRVLGCAPEDLPADRAAVRRMWHPDDAARLLPLTEEGIRSGRGFDFEHRIVWRDGSVRWVHTLARVLQDGPRGPRVVSTVQDITERRLQARAVIERDRFFDGSRDVFCILSRGGLFLQVNPALCRLLGRSREELIGRNAFDFTHEGDRARVEAEFARALRGAARASLPARALAAGGGVRWIEWSSSQSPDGDVYAVGHDVTERMAAEAERERTLAELSARNEELQQFAYIASHDLQEPLRKIQAFGDRLRTRFAEVLDTDGRDYLARMDNAAKRMSTLIADLLDYSRVATRGEPFAVVPLSDALADALGDLEESIRAAGATIEAAPLPVVEGDRRQLAQVFQNLVGNAVKYRHPARVPVVRIAAERFEEPLASAPEASSPWVRVEVSDNGIGFDPVHRERIFAPFQRLHGRAEYAGTGIGLAIVRKIVERHGGRVRAEGRPDEGARFVVELPLRQPQASPGA